MDHSGNVSVQRSISNMESKISRPTSNYVEDDDECLRLKGLIAIEQHRFICERIEVQNAQTQLAVMCSELMSLKEENFNLKGIITFIRRKATLLET